MTRESLGGRKSLGGGLGGPPSSARKSTSSSHLTQQQSGNGTNQQHGGSAYPAPLLKVADIVSGLHIMECDCTENDILKPTPQKFQQICFILMDALGSWPIEDVEKPTWTEDIVEHPDLIAEPAAFACFLTRIASLLQRVGVQNFTAYDLLKPEPLRVKVILSALLNFGIYREEKVTHFEDCLLKSNELSVHRTQMEERNKALTMQLQALQKQREEEVAEIASLQAVNQGEKKGLVMLNSEHTEVVALLKDQKQTLAQKRACTQQKAEYCAQLEGEKEKQQRLIVNNPHEIRQSAVLAKDQIAAGKEEIASDEAKARDMAKQAGSIRRNCLELEDAFAAVQMEFEAQAKAKEMMQYVHEYEAECARHTSAMDERNHLAAVVQKQVVSTVDNLNALGRQHAIKTERRQEATAQLQAQWQSISEANEDAQNVVADRTRSLRDIQNKMAASKAQLDGELQEHQKKTEGVLDHYYKQNMKTLAVTLECIDCGAT